MTLKIAVTGTHSTGKSSFLAKLEARLQADGLRTGRVESVASQAMKLGLPILRHHTFVSTMWILTQGIRLEIECGLKVDVVLVDRPVIDALGYLNAALRLRKESLGGREARLLDELVRGHMGSYSFTAATVLDLTVPLGQGRDDDEEFRRVAGEEIERLVTSLDATTPRLRSDNVGDIQELAFRVASGGARGVPSSSPSSASGLCSEPTARFSRR